MTWKSLRISSRKASNGSSVRSISSIRSTGGPGGIGLQRQEERALEQEALVEDVVRQALPPFGPGLAAELREADLQHLAGVVPLVERRRGVQPLVALEADEPPAQGLGEDLGDLGLADARLAFEEKRACRA